MSEAGCPMNKIDRRQGMEEALYSVCPRLNSHFVLPSSNSFSPYPTMCVTHFDHGRKDVIPGLLVVHHCIREHATIPADMIKCRGQLSIFIAKPMSGILDDIQLAIRISGQAVTPCLVMGTRTEYGSVILSYVEVNGIRTKRRSQFFQTFCQSLTVTPFEIRWQNPVFRLIGTQQIKEGVGHICSKAEVRMVYCLQHVQHLFPAMHASPADFAFSGNFFAKFSGSITSLTEGLCDQFVVSGRIRSPGINATGRVDANHTVRTYA